MKIRLNALFFMCWLCFIAKLPKRAIVIIAADVPIPKANNSNPPLIALPEDVAPIIAPILSPQGKTPKTMPKKKGLVVFIFFKSFDIFNLDKM